ncbi:MAG TPA: hypothetical protein VGV38_23650 [Pyrinomonadaceae bacterium]|nr:hypothetical protein [Pyrinomonadaceae bacterium]
MSRFVVVALLLGCFAACGPQARDFGDNTPPRKATPAPTPTPADPAPEKAVAKGSGKFNQYGFTYQRDGERATADFCPTPLPRTDSAVVAAARLVILEAFGEKMEGFPRPVAWQHEGQSVQAVKLGGQSFDYIFWPVKEETKEVRRILFWRVGKGSY